MIKLLIVVMLASIIQNFLFTRQYREMNAFFYKLRERGNVLVGKKTGVFRKGIILMLLLNEREIREAYVLEGRTVFSKLKRLEELENKDLYEVEIEDKVLELAFVNALENYRN